MQDETEALPRGRRFSIACFPKSGSTFITKCLCNYTGFPQVIIATSAEVQELSAQRLEDLETIPSFISQTHFHPTRHNLRLIDKYGFENIFLYRNVFDCIVSLRDMYIERIDTAEGIWKNSFFSQWGHYSRGFLDLDASEQYDYIIECAASWYLLCYSSWMKKINEEGYPSIVIRYEAFFENVEAGFGDLTKALDIDNEEKLRSFQYPGKEKGGKGVRFNEGRVGRGRELLNRQQQDRILQLAGVLEKGAGCDLTAILD